MNIHFEQNNELEPGEVTVVIQSASLSSEVIELIQRLEERESTDVLPITVDERTHVLAVENIIAIEVFGHQLEIHTKDTTYKIRGVLKRIIERLPSKNFVQIAKGTVINIDYLNSMEASFSGNMLAFLENGLKMTVSRKYLPNLKKHLGL